MHLYLGTLHAIKDRFIDETKGMQLEDMHTKVAPHKIRHPEEHPAGLD